MRLSLIALALIAGCHASGTAPSPESGTPAGDWPAYGRTLAGDRYSPLAEINKSNVEQMKPICSYATPETSSLQTGPIVIAGTMYFTNDTVSYAIDGATCAEKWRSNRKSARPNGQLMHRGFAYANGMLFRGTSDSHVLAMDPTDGHVVWDHPVEVSGPGIGFPMAPLAADGMVYVGNAGGDNTGVTGHVWALDVKDGHQVWRFDVVPESGPIRETWSNKRIPLSGGAFWSSFTFDAAAHVLYVPAGNPAPDFDVELRTGDNLWSNSVIALDARSGRMLAYNQLVKKDNHDWDVDAPPTLVTTRSGKKIIASANKDGFLSILDRTAVDSRRQTPDTRLPPEIPLLSQSLITRRVNENVKLSRDHPTYFCPGITGGTEWNGAAYSPPANALYVGAVDWCVSVQLRKDTIAIPQTGRQWLGNENLPGGFRDPPDSARGWLTSVDAESGKIRWKMQSPRPIVAGVTTTAGGLVFAANTGGRVWAFDADDGKVLWTAEAGQGAGGGIVSYSAGGRQLVAVAVGMKSTLWPGPAGRSRILVYGLK